MCVSKKCNKCGEVKRLEEFAKDHRKATGRAGHCIECKRAMDRARWLSDERKEQNKKARDKHNTKIKEQRFFSRLLSGLSKPVYHRTCAKCGKKEVLKKEPVGRAVNYCSDCYRTIGTNTGKKIHKPAVRTCIHCSTEFNASAGMARVCLACAEKNHKRLRNIYKTKRRAIERGTEAENIDKYQVFHRDNWRCKDCGRKVQKKRIYDDNAAELDHIIPLAKGGTHTWDNVQTLCRKCNQTKSDNAIGQLRIRLG